MTRPSPKSPFPEDRLFLTGINAYFNSTIQPALGKQMRELAWEKRLSHSRFIVVLLVGIAIITIGYFISGFGNLAAYFITAIVVCAVAGFCLDQRKNAVEQKILLTVRKLLAEFWSLHLDQGVDQNLLATIEDASLLLPYKKPATGWSISGSFCNIGMIAQRVTLPDREEGKPPVFDGWLFRFDYAKKIQGTTIVAREQVMENILGRRGSGMELVKLEDPYFEEYFAVYGEDQIAARYLLTPQFIEDYMIVAQNIGYHLQLVFHQGQLHIAYKQSEIIEYRAETNIPEQLEDIVWQEVGIYLLLADMIDILKINRVN